MIKVNQIKLSRSQLASFLNILVETLAIWKSTKRYALECFKENGEIFYWLSDINKFLGIDEAETDTEPLLCRKEASKYLSQFKHVSPHTLASPKFIERYPYLKPLRVGKHIVRYQRKVLDRFGEDMLRPY